MCAVITDFTPASIAARKGARCLSHSSSECCTSGSPWWESTAVSPCPGKCLAQPATPAACSPLTYAAECRAATTGSDPKDRVPITGLSGLVFRSASGA